MYFVNLDLVQRPPPQLFAREPTPRMMGPFLSCRELPLGRHYHSVISFSDIVFDMLLPHGVRTWTARELLPSQLRCLRVRSHHEPDHIYPYGFQLL